VKARRALTSAFVIIHYPRITSHVLCPRPSRRYQAAARSIENHLMADLKAKFDKAAEDIKKLKDRPDNDTLLKLYALYKQGSEGDVSGPKPGFFDFVGTAKYEAWAKLKGTKNDDAMQKYVDLVKKLGA
jgi:acyl-CoA-binding protein